MFEEKEFYDECEFSSHELQEIDKTAEAIMFYLEGKPLSIAYEALTVCFECLERIEKEDMQARDTQGLNGHDGNKR